VGAGDLSRALQRSVLELAGEAGLGQCLGSLSVKYFNPDTGLAIVRTSRAAARVTQAAAALLTSLAERRVAVHSLHVAGTIRSCQEAAIAHNRHILLQMARAAPASAPLLARGDAAATAAAPAAAAVAAVAAAAIAASNFPPAPRAKLARPLRKS
jgi:ribonuclease P/MRP protein subunit POP5